MNKCVFEMERIYEKREIYIIHSYVYVEERRLTTDINIIWMLSWQVASRHIREVKEHGIEVWIWRQSQSQQQRVWCYEVNRAQHKETAHTTSASQIDNRNRNRIRKWNGLYSVCSVGHRNISYANVWYGGNGNRMEWEAGDESQRNYCGWDMRCGECWERNGNASQQPVTSLIRRRISTNTRNIHIYEIYFNENFIKHMVCLWMERNIFHNFLHFSPDGWLSCR